MKEFIPSDEVLMAYADGELDASVAQAVEAAMMADAALVGRLVVFLRSRRLVRAVYAVEGLEPVGEGLALAARARGRELGAAVQVSSRRANKGTWQDWLRGLGWAPIGAFAGALGLLAVLQPWSRDPHGPFATLESGEALALMYQLASGDTADLREGTLRVMSTVEIKGGAVCREVNLEGPDARTEAVTCASPQKPWQVLMASRVDDAGDAFTPSAASHPADSFFQHNEAGARLTGSDEQRVLARLRESHEAGT
jgi:hypothetical protein